MVLSEWFITWMEQYKKNRVKSGTYYNYKKYFDSMIKGRLGDKKVSDIRGEHIQRFYNELEKEGYALSSIKIVSAILNGCMQQAMTKEQQALFMEYAKDSYLYNLFAVMLRADMRNGEIRGLKYSDVDKKKNVIHIQRTLKYIEGQGYFEDRPKTRTSKRDIPLTADLAALLDAQRNYWDFKVERLDRYLFCNEKGEPLSRDRLQAEIKRIVKRIQAEKHDFPRITPHIFRHTFATRAIEAGMPPAHIRHTGHRGRNAAQGIKNYSGAQLSCYDDGFIQSCAAGHESGRNGEDCRSILRGAAASLFSVSEYLIMQSWTFLGLCWPFLDNPPFPWYS